MSQAADLSVPAAGLSAGQSEPAARRPGPHHVDRADRARKLHVGHFAFMRAVVQGIALVEAWQRYLPNETREARAALQAGEKTPAAGGRFVDRPDERLVQHTVEWIRREFAAVSRREHKPGTARLLEFDFRKLLDPGPALPSLEDFAVEHQLEDLSQAEQTAAYEERYRAELARARRRGRLMQRQLEALKWLESLVAQPPRAGDAVVSWLATSLGEHLQAADIFTVAQLIDRINGIGRRWYSGISGIGAVKARRIEAWLHEHEGTIGRGLGAHIERPRSALFRHELERLVQPAADIRPLEKFNPPAELDGRNGLYRRPQAQCLLQASNDVSGKPAAFFPTAYKPQTLPRIEGMRRSGYGWTEKAAPGCGELGPGAGALRRCGHDGGRVLRA